MKGSRPKPDIQFNNKEEVKSQEKSGYILLWIDSLKYEDFFHYMKFDLSACTFCISQGFQCRQDRRYIIAGIFND